MLRISYKIYKYEDDIIQKRKSKFLSVDSFSEIKITIHGD